MRTKNLLYRIIVRLRNKSCKILGTESVLNKLQTSLCLSDIFGWMAHYRFKLNKSKSNLCTFSQTDFSSDFPFSNTFSKIFPYSALSKLGFYSSVFEHLLFGKLQSYSSTNQTNGRSLDLSLSPFTSTLLPE